MKIIAHRGGVDRYPQLTVAGARHSLDVGAYAAEIDVRQLADGTLVVSHDPDASALFGSPAEVEHMSLAEWRALRHTAAPTLTAHTLDDYLDAGLRRLLLHVQPGVLAAVLDRLDEPSTAAHVVLGLTSVADVVAAKARRPATEVLGFLPRPELVGAFADAGADIIRLWEPWVGPDRLAAIASHGRRCWVMAGDYRDGTVGHTATAHLTRWRDAGVDGVLVDLVEPALAHLQGRKESPRR